MLVLDYLFYIIREYRVFTCLGLSVSWALLAFIYSRVAAERQGIRTPLRWLLKLIPLLVLVVLLLGRTLSRAYVLQRGQEGSGTVVALRPTATTVNKRRVMEHKTLLKLQDGRIFTTSFDDQSANVYGANEKWYHLPPTPIIGQKFSVRYLPNLPHNFLIMANDVRSEFGQTVQCNPLRIAYAEALQAYEFDKNDAELKAQLLVSLDALINSRCLPEDEKEMYRIMRERVK